MTPALDDVLDRLHVVALLFLLLSGLWMFIWPLLPRAWRLEWSRGGRT